jgi:deoxyribonuclease V
MTVAPGGAWPGETDGLVELQEQLGPRAAEALSAAPFRLPARPLIGGCFVAFARGEAGPGRPGDRAFAAALVWDPGHDSMLRRGRGGAPARSVGRALKGTTRKEPRRAADVVEQAVVQQAVGAAYVPGLLALREGPVLALAIDALSQAPDVLLVDASGADHPRRAGLAVHLGWALDVPTVGITRRPLQAGGEEPELVRGRWTSLTLDGDVVAASLCTRTGARPVVVHAAWRTDVETALAVARAPPPPKAPERRCPSRRPAGWREKRATSPAPAETVQPVTARSRATRNDHLAGHTWRRACSAAR